MSCSLQATKTKHCLDQSDMLLLFSDPVPFYMCNIPDTVLIYPVVSFFILPYVFSFSVPYYHFGRIFSEILYTKKQDIEIYLIHACN